MGDAKKIRCDQRQPAMPTGCDWDRLGRSHSCSFDQRRQPETLRTAMATAFFLPNQNDKPLAAGNAGVEKVPLQHGVVLRHEQRDHHGWGVGALALVDARGVGSSPGRGRNPQFAVRLGYGGEREFVGRNAHRKRRGTAGIRIWPNRPEGISTTVITNNIPSAKSQ